MLRPVLPEDDRVEYVLHCPPCNVEALVIEMRAFVAVLCPFLQTHMWQRESFDLAVLPGECAVGGSVAFGDSVSDEWLVAFLVFELTRAFPGVVAELHDGDGQFLLVEAAMELPEWLEPETADNRCFVFGGELHLLGMDDEEEEGEEDGKHASSRAAAPRSVTLEEGVRLVRRLGPSGETLAPERVRRVLAKRLEEAPRQSLVEGRHRTKMVLPDLLARMVARRPEMAAGAVERFYHRDEEAERSLRRLARFDWASRREVVVKLSRLMFVQVLQQSFAAPCPRFELPAVESQGRRAAELGMRLTCGFELWAAEKKKSEREELERELAKGEEEEGREEKGEEDEKESDEQWMFVSPAQVEDWVGVHETEAEEVKKMMDNVTKMKSFVDGEATMDGAETMHKEEEEEGNEDLDVGRFFGALQRGLGLPESFLKEREEGDEEAREQQKEMDEELRGMGRNEDYDEDVDMNLVEAIVKTHESGGGETGPLAHLLSLLRAK